MASSCNRRESSVRHNAAQNLGDPRYVRVPTPAANDEAWDGDRRVSLQRKVHIRVRTPIENVGRRGCNYIVAHTGGERIEAPIAIMKVHDLASRILAATLEGVEVGVAQHTDLLV